MAASPNMHSAFPIFFAAQTPWELTWAILSIVLIDIVLAGDNAVVIALAVRTLPAKERMLGIILGSGVAVVLRVALTFVAAQLLVMNYVKLVGGLFILWIAVKLLLDNTGDKVEGKAAWAGSGRRSGSSCLRDITMSVDNVLAVAAASKGSFALLLFGLGLSIPLVVFTSNLLSKLMDRYPVAYHLRGRGHPRQGGWRHDHDRPAHRADAASRALAGAHGRGCAGGRASSCMRHDSGGGPRAQQTVDKDAGK